MSTDFRTASGVVGGHEVPFSAVYREGNPTPAVVDLATSVPVSYEDLVATVWLLASTGEDVSEYPTDPGSPYNLHQAVLEMMVAEGGWAVDQARQEIAAIDPSDERYACLAEVREAVGTAYGLAPAAEPVAVARAGTEAPADFRTASGAVGGHEVPFSAVHREGNPTPAAFNLATSVPVSYEDLVATVWLMTRTGDAVSDYSLEPGDPYNLHQAVLETMVAEGGWAVDQARQEIAAIGPSDERYACLAEAREVISAAYNLAPTSDVPAVDVVEVVEVAGLAAASNAVSTDLDAAAGAVGAARRVEHAPETGAEVADDGPFRDGVDEFRDAVAPSAGAAGGGVEPVEVEAGGANSAPAPVGDDAVAPSVEPSAELPSAAWEALAEQMARTDASLRAARVAVDRLADARAEERRAGEERDRAGQVARWHAADAARWQSVARDAADSVAEPYAVR